MLVVQRFTRAGYLLARKGEPLMLSRLQMKQQLIKEYGDLLPKMTPDEWRRVRGEQEIIVRYEPERALATMEAAAVKAGIVAAGSSAPVRFHAA